ncbi:hypothetical protein HDU67_006123, partial [Dinochytrium kinnereticum]
MSSVGRRIKQLEATTPGWFGKVLQVDLKRWSKKRIITITDSRPRYSIPHTIRIFPELANKDRFTVTVETSNPHGASTVPKTLGTLFFESPIKLSIESKPLRSILENHTMNDSARPPSSGEKSPSIVQYSMAGDLKNFKFVVVKKQLEDRRQELVGDVSGRVVVRRNVREVKGACQ